MEEPLKIESVEEETPEMETNDDSQVAESNEDPEVNDPEDNGTISTSRKHKIKASCMGCFKSYLGLFLLLLFYSLGGAYYFYKTQGKLVEFF